MKCNGKFLKQGDTGKMLRERWSNGYLVEMRLLTELNGTAKSRGALDARGFYFLDIPRLAG